MKLEYTVGKYAFFWDTESFEIRVLKRYALVLYCPVIIHKLQDDIEFKRAFERAQEWFAKEYLRCRRGKGWEEGMG